MMPSVKADDVTDMDLIIWDAIWNYTYDYLLTQVTALDEVQRTIWNVLDQERAGRFEGFDSLEILDEATATAVKLSQA